MAYHYVYLPPWILQQSHDVIWFDARAQYFLRSLSLLRIIGVRMDKR